METRNIWEIKLASKLIFFSNIEEVIEAIKEGKINGNFIVMDEYDSSIREPFTHLEKLIADSNIHMNYTDNNHQAFYHNTTESWTPPIFGVNFFNKHKDKIINAFLEYISRNDLQTIKINNYIFNDQIFEKLLNKNVPLLFYNVTLTEEQVKKLQDNCIEAFVDEKKVSSNYISKLYTKTSIKNKNSIILYIEELDNINIKNLLYAQDNCEINLLSNNDNDYIGTDIVNTDNNNIHVTNDYDYLKIKDFLVKLNTLNKPFKINIEIHKRALLEKSNILNNKYKNLDITFEEKSGIKYTLKEYLEEDQKLNSLIKDIKNSNLTPYEKYIAVYNIVKKYKPYREGVPWEARELKYILNNEYIVCVGFANLLEVLLEKVGINCITFYLNIDTSYDNGYSKEEIPVEKEGHARILFNIDDSKYDIHGIYMADPTWDNVMTEDLLNYSSLTIDALETNKRASWNNEISLILDVHSFQEFTDQINYYFSKKIIPIVKKHHMILRNSKTEKEIILESYELLIAKLKEIFKYLDFDNWNKIYSKYKFETEKDYIEFLTEFGHFIVSRVNKPIDSKKTINAHFAGIRNLLAKLRKRQFTKKYYERQNESFPYYLTDETYLGEKNNVTKK